MATTLIKGGDVQHLESYPIHRSQQLGSYG
jgi:hypothetical protein